MKSFIILLLFIGMFMIVQGVYEQKYQNMQKLVRTEYRFIPRTLYDEVLTKNDLNALYKNYFDSPDPWHERNIGVDIKSS
jgi:hypothetical protein